MCCDSWSNGEPVAGQCLDCGAIGGAMSDKYNSVEEVVAAMMETANHYGLGWEVMEDYKSFVISDQCVTIDDHIRAASEALYEWDI